LATRFGDEKDFIAVLVLLEHKAPLRKVGVRVEATRRAAIIHLFCTEG
jgi:hypothetical protein